MAALLIAALPLAAAFLGGCSERPDRGPDSAAAASPSTAVPDAGSSGGSAAGSPSAPPAPPATPSGTRLVLVAPVGLGPLKDIYPEGRLAYARRIHLYIDWLIRDATSEFGASLPDSDSPRWQHGPVAIAGGANLVLLTQVLSLTTVEDSIDPNGHVQQCAALIEMRGLDANGNLVFRRKATGYAPMKGLAKFRGPSNEPQSLATWQAISTDLGAVQAFLDSEQELSTTPSESGVSVPRITLVPVVIDSIPSHADVLVDAIFRGTTPLQLPLPARDVQISIERSGYHPWQRHVLATAGLHLDPVLDPLPGTAAPASASAPAATAAPAPAAPSAAAPAALAAPVAPAARAPATP